MHSTLRIATFNIHKGLTHFNARFAIHEQRELLRNLRSDIVFLQEVRDQHALHSRRFSDWPKAGQASFLADAIGQYFSYGKNSIYPAGNHGNAILSKFPTATQHNANISAHNTEERGMLHCSIQIPEWEKPLHAICVHLGLFARWRHAQLQMVSEYIESHVPSNEPLIIAGDFNDWTTRAGVKFASRLNLKEVFEEHTGRHAKSFPSILPIMSLDRIYVRGFHVQHVEVHAGPRFIKVSDHAVLSATINKK